jgi:hypothetical protein
MRFSERIGKRAPKDVIQVDSMDNDLKNGLWNVVLEQILAPLRGFSDDYSDLSFTPGLQFVLISLWRDFFKKPIDSIPAQVGDGQLNLKNYFFSGSYLDAYDFIEFLSSIKLPNINTKTLIVRFNEVLKKELSGFRFVGGQLTPIVNAVEINDLEQALQNTNKSNYKGASIHLSAALEKLSDRREPDYRNSIKESISAVESVCQAITGDPKATLGPALKKIEQKMPLHGALKEGLLKLYGYTSDSDGIRHALQDEPNLSQEDALFMLVTCSAFVNYLTVKADKAGAAGS